MHEPERHPFCLNALADARRELDRENDRLFESDTPKELQDKLKSLSLLPHWIKGGARMPITVSEMDPGFYDGLQNYRLAPKLQECLERVVKSNTKLKKMGIALVDLTKDIHKPEFAGFRHKVQLFAASIPKIAVMLAAYQLQHDLRVMAYENPSVKTADALFDRARATWAATQQDAGQPAARFTSGVDLRGKLVVLTKGGKLVPLTKHKAPQLDNVFRPSDRKFFFRSGGKSDNDTWAELDSATSKFDKAVAALARATKDKNDAAIASANSALAKATIVLQNLAFLERLGVAAGGRVPASNVATASVVRDIGYLYIASVLLQTGLYDPARGGGLWLGSDYAGGAWSRALVTGGSHQSATAGSLASFMTLLVQDRLVSRVASREMRLLLQKPNPRYPATGSWFQNSLIARSLTPSLVLSKVGSAAGGVDDFAYMERVSSGKTLRYVAVGLRAAKSDALNELIVKLDKCVVDNNP